MYCQKCKGICQKAGRQRNGVQKLYCTGCKKYQQAGYRNRAYESGINPLIRLLVCEGVGIRGVARVVKIAVGTVARRIRSLANCIERPDITEVQPTFEVDELWTYIDRKENEYRIAYALNRQTRQVVDFIIGKRRKATLKELIDRLLLSNPKTIRTDRLTLYQRIIPKEVHRSGSYCINRIARKNLSIRTHLKRLSRRTICFSRSVVMLESCLRLYFWK
jgi:insertion element IS1 protein InsB